MSPLHYVASSNLYRVPVTITVTVIYVTVTVPVIITIIVIYITDITILPLVELPVQAQQILATLQTLKASNVLEMADPTTTQAVADMVTLLEMLTTAPDQVPQVTILTNELLNATHQVEALTNELACSETTINMLRVELTKAKQSAAALARAIPDGGRGGSDKERIPMPEKFDGTRSKLRAFLTQLWLIVATYPNEQAKLRLAVNCLISDAID